MTESKEKVVGRFRSRIDLLGSGLISGSAVLFLSMTIVNAGNYVYNLILGRWLGPAAFADLSLIVTLMLMVTFVTASFQLTAAKFSAAYTADNDQKRLVGLRSWLGKQAWIFGVVSMIILVAGAPLWQNFFKTQEAWPFVILGLGLPVYFAQGVDRGMLQGQTRFGWLSGSYQAEMWARLLTGAGLVAIGFGVNGAVGSILISFIAAWVVARKIRSWVSGTDTLEPESRKEITKYAGPVLVAHISQILINNSDILIVKRFFEAEEAGRYAALALIGRIVFFATWSVVMTLFPIVAQKQQRGEKHRHLLFAGLGMVALVSAVIIAASIIIPEWIVGILFGDAYLSIAPLLWLYAVATAIYALANVVISYRLSAGQGKGSTLAVFGGVIQVVGLSLFHQTLQQVVVAQIIIMSGLFVALIIWDAWLEISARRRETSSA